MGLQLCLCNSAGARVELVLATPFARILGFLRASKNCMKTYFFYPSINCLFCYIGPRGL
jgi:hypothetical protein